MINFDGVSNHNNTVKLKPEETNMAHGNMDNTLTE